MGTQFLRVATTTYCEQVFGLTRFLAMSCSCHTDSCTLLAVSTAHPLLPIPCVSRAKRVLCAPDGFTEPTEGSDLVGRDPLSCHTPAHTFALFCAFLHAPKIQLVSFQAFPHSLQKTPGGGYRVCVGSQFLRVATTTYCERVFGLTQFLAMTCSCHTDSVPPPLSGRKK